MKNNVITNKEILERDIKTISKIIVATHTGRYIRDDGSCLMLNSVLSDISLKYLRSELKKNKI